MPTLGSIHWKTGPIGACERAALSVHPGVMRDEDQHPEAWLAGSWLRPAVLTVFFLGTAAGHGHKHGDLSSVIVAAICIAGTWCVWRIWLRLRGHREPPNERGTTH